MPAPAASQHFLHLAPQNLARQRNPFHVQESDAGANAREAFEEFSYLLTRKNPRKRFPDAVGVVIEPSLTPEVLPPLLAKPLCMLAEVFQVIAREPLSQADAEVGAEQQCSQPAQE